VSIYSTIFTFRFLKSHLLVSLSLFLIYTTILYKLDNLSQRQDIMLFYQTLFVLLHLAAAAPSNSHHKSSKASAKNLKCPTFDLPWTVSDLTIYKPAKQPTASAHSAISFRFKDTNPLLNLETNCAGTIVNDACEAESGGYVLCGDVRVGFKVDQNVILITRAFLDDWSVHI